MIVPIPLESLLCMLERKVHHRGRFTKYCGKRYPANKIPALNSCCVLGPLFCDMTYVSFCVYYLLNAIKLCAVAGLGIQPAGTPLF